ncbi:MAG: TMEM165/GDT1 family protein [Firmicutes bacterium]|nr:TMEM165/GDT1 family protein [Bacillota bacterium]
MAAFFLAFLTTLLAEMGDKTQLVTLTLSSRFPPRQVLAGALAALAAITAPAVVLGDFLAQLLPDKVALIASGCFFVVAGTLMLFWSKSTGTPAQKRGSTVVVQTFLLIFFAELGDKTQLTAIALTAATGEPLSVFLGAMGGQFINHAAAAYLGSRFLTRLPAGTVRLASALLFVLFGVLFLFLAVRS